MEGEGSNLITVRALGTAFRVAPAKCSVSPYGKPQKPVLTISNLPNDRLLGFGLEITRTKFQDIWHWLVGDSKSGASARERRRTRNA